MHQVLMEIRLMQLPYFAPFVSMTACNLLGASPASLCTIVMMQDAARAPHFMQQLFLFSGGQEIVWLSGSSTMMKVAVCTY